MPTVTQIKAALRTWAINAVDGTGAEGRVIFVDQGQPRPARPYLDVKVNGIETRGRDELRPIDDDGLRDVVGVRAVRATINAYGPDALELAERTRSALWLENTTDLLRAAGISFWRAEPTLDITTEIDTSIEPRAVFEALFGVASVQTENVGAIECVEGEGTYIAPDGSPVLTVAIDSCDLFEVMVDDDDEMDDDDDVMVESP